MRRFTHAAAVATEEVLLLGAGVCVGGSPASYEDVTGLGSRHHDSSTVAC